MTADMVWQHGDYRASLETAGILSGNAPMAGYPKVYNVEVDPHEDLNVAGPFGWTAEQPLLAVEKYFATLKDHPNPRARDITVFKNPTS